MEIRSRVTQDLFVYILYIFESSSLMSSSSLELVDVSERDCKSDEADEKKEEICSGAVEDLVVLNKLLRYVTLKERLNATQLEENANVYQAAFGVAKVFFVFAALFGILEGWWWVDAIWFTFVTLTTIGYGDMTPTTFKSRVYLILMISYGVGTMALFLGELFDYFARQRKREMMAVEILGPKQAQVTRGFLYPLRQAITYIVPLFSKSDYFDDLLNIIFELSTLVFLWLIFGAIMGEIEGKIENIRTYIHARGSNICERNRDKINANIVFKYKIQLQVGLMWTAFILPSSRRRQSVLETSNPSIDAK